MQALEVQSLCQAVQAAPEYLKNFVNRESYETAFCDYKRRFGPLYVQACEEEAPELLAEALIDELEVAWEKRRPWERGRVRLEEKLTVVEFLNPMLKALPDPRCGELAEALRRIWAQRWPKEAYQTSGYEELAGGFQKKFLGFVLDK